jgi:hypothetical protein
MKKGTVVTEQNLAMIFGRVKNALKGSNIIYSRVVYDSGLNRAYEYLNMKPGVGFISKNGNVVMTLKSGLRFSQSDVNIKEGVGGQKYISIGGCEINIGDKIYLAYRAIFIFKKEKFICVNCCSKSHYIEVWQF